MVWVRDLDASEPIPENDNLQAFVLHPCVSSPPLLLPLTHARRCCRTEFGSKWDGLKSRLNNLRDRSLGPKDQRTKEGVAFETSARATRIKGARCYSVGINTQKPRNVAGPAAGNKIYEGDSPADDEHLKWRKEVLTVRSSLRYPFQGTC